MACYRLIFRNDQAYEVEIDVSRMEDAQWRMCSAVLYRVGEDGREPQPLLRADGEPLTIYAVSEQATVNIAMEVLVTVAGSTLSRITRCGAAARHRSPSPPPV
jgi:hypothetical protein